MNREQLKQLEDDLWAAADNLRANTDLKSSETVPNANYLWINLFATSLKERGRAALVMANSASDARHSEAEIRENLIKNNLIYGMLTLPSNMFYTVTLPATLWFFDRAKPDDKILFIDARNIFTQIDRAHREFSEEQIQNIAIISKLHRGETEAFIRLIDDYFAQGMACLLENQEQVEPVSEQLLEVLGDQEGKQAVQELLSHWQGLGALYSHYQAYREQLDFAAIAESNKQQRALRAHFDSFFANLHAGLKVLDKIVRRQEKATGNKQRGMKQLKEALEQLHKEVKASEGFYRHIHWLQERFPEAVYEDVTGLCKLATPEEVKEQDFSLNPGRYVGVVIEEDGKTEEEFIEELLAMNQQLEALNQEAIALAEVIDVNIKALTEDY